MRTRRLAIASLLALALPASAHDFVCRNGSAERMISVEHEIEGQDLPCVVKYDKKDTGDVLFPWNAANTPGFCEEKAEYLADRLGKFGWTCERTDAEPQNESY
ncbi:MAG: hypothetical protein KDI19_12960 [Pseudomonadales bacterium]|nr:hypothetical protein [Pseudomonadales bacterium]